MESDNLILNESFDDLGSWSAYMNTPNEYKPSNSFVRAIEVIREGDIVRLVTGQAPLKVLRVYGSVIEAQYVTRRNIISRNYNDFVLYSKNEVTETKVEKKEDTMKDKLFEVVVEGAASRYGVGVAVNSKGQYVLEMKDSNTYEAFDVANVKKVMPFTYDVMFSGKSTVYSYLGTDGSVGVGDILLLEGDSSMNVAKVVAINTASENATKRFNGRKIVTEALL
jgi:hypothetical protein